MCNNPSGMVLIKLSLWNKVASVVSTAERDALSRSSNPLRTLYPFDQLVKLKPAKSPAQLAHIPVELVPAFDEGRLNMNLRIMTMVGFHPIQDHVHIHSDHQPYFDSVLTILATHSLKHSCTTVHLSLKATTLNIIKIKDEQFGEDKMKNVFHPKFENGLSISFLVQ